MSVVTGNWPGMQTEKEDSIVQESGGQVSWKEPLGFEPGVGRWRLCTIQVGCVVGSSVFRCVVPVERAAILGKPL